MLLDLVKKQASSFLQEKYRVARLAFTDVTPAELLAEEATNNNPCGPDARTMTQIAEASFFVDDYWRIVEVLHRRFDCIDWKLWRQSYKSLVLLEFLLTHGALDFAEEFQCDYEIIQELGKFKHIDEKGYDWGANMEKRSDQIMELLGNIEALEEARFKALKLTKEIQGFGSSTPSSSSSSSSSSPSSVASHASSWASYSTSSSIYNNIDDKDLSKVERMHVWDCLPTGESGSLLSDPDDDDEKNANQTGGEMSTLVKSKVTLRSLSDTSRMAKRRLDRQYSARH
ncbi:hypothetical protein ACFE04_015676 [Oxalis oulophora]